MADPQDLQLQHHTFAKETFAYLLHKSRGGKRCDEDFELFRPHIGDAILVLSYIFSKDYWNVFIRIFGNLKQVSMFERYCRIVPVEKDERYFYNFLRRISLIFELTMYCRDEGFNYYNTGLQCAADYADVQFFESSGGWKKLQHVAQYIASLGSPLTLIMSKENLPSGKEIKNFPAVVDEVRHKFMSEGNLKVLYSKAMQCITKMKDILKPPKEEDAIQDSREKKTREENEIDMDRLQTQIHKTPEDNTKKSKSELEMEIAIATYFRHCYLPIAASVVTPTNLTPSDQDVSLICEESPPTEDHSETECVQENPSETKATTFADADQHSKNDELDKNLVAREECSNPPPFIVPREYLDIREVSSSRKWNHLYCAKMCPPSVRRNLDGHLKKILDKNIESQNSNIMPSGDILVCPPGSPSKNEEILVIFPENNTDEEGDPFIDELICLFKKLEIDSQVEETGYSLRARGVAKKRPISELDKQGSVMMEMTASASRSPSKIPRRSPRKSPEAIPTEASQYVQHEPWPSKPQRNEALYAKVLIKFYKKYFASFLDLYFKTDFPISETDIQSPKSSESNVDSCEYVFAVSASIMARRKALLPEPEESKPVMGIRLYKDFSVDILPLPVQKFLDSQIENNNYFEPVRGIYGVGPNGPALLENIWALLYSADRPSNSLQLSKIEADKMPGILSSYEPVLQIFFAGASYFTATDRSILELILHKGLEDLLSKS